MSVLYEVFHSVTEEQTDISLQTRKKWELARPSFKLGEKMTLCVQAEAHTRVSVRKCVCASLRAMKNDQDY